MNKPVKHLMKYVFLQEVEEKTISPPLTPPEKGSMSEEKLFPSIAFLPMKTNPCAGLIS
jgi:hypothetical protein